MAKKSYKLTLPSDAMLAIRRSASWTGEVTIEPLSRKPTGFFDSKRKSAKPQPIGRDILWLAEIWNVHLDRPKSDLRNRYASKADLKSARKSIGKAIKMWGMDGLEIWIDSYFQQCKQGKHIWNGINHGYKHLGGFCGAVVRHAEKGEELWWMTKKIEDDHAELTFEIADKFAESFLGRSKFGLLNPSNAYGRFKDVGDKISKLRPSLPFHTSAIIEMLMECVKQRWSDGVVSPGHLASEHVWKVAFPQYLKGVLDRND